MKKKQTGTMVTKEQDDEETDCFVVVDWVES